MAEHAAQFLLATLILSGLALVSCAVACWIVVSRSTPRRKLPAAPSTPISDAHYASLKAEMAELYATLEKLTTTVMRISSRQGMRDIREARATPQEPPPGTPKAQLRLHYGLAGKSPQEIADMARGKVSS